MLQKAKSSAKMKTMKEEKTTVATVILNDIFTAVATLLAVFGMIAIFAVGGFGAICSVIGIFKSFTGANVALSLLVSLCGLATAAIMFYLEYLVSKVFLDGISEYIIDRRKKTAALRKSK